MHFQFQGKVISASCRTRWMRWNRVTSRPGSRSICFNISRGWGAQNKSRQLFGWRL